MIESGSPTWGSAREVHLAKDQFDWLAQLQVADSRFDNNTSEGPVNRPILPHSVSRVWRGGWRRLVSVFPRATAGTRKVARLIKRTFSRTLHIVLNQRPLPKVFFVDSTSIRVVDLSDESAREKALEANDPYLLFARSSKSVRTEELKAFARQMVGSSKGDFWYADSVSPQGFRIYRPAPSHLLTEQSDWFGAVIGVRTTVAADILRDPDSLRTIPQRLGLGIPENRCVHIPIEIGVSAFTSTLIEYPANPRVPKGDVLVSIIIPTRGTAGDVGGESREFVVDAVRSIIDRTSYEKYELIVVADDPTPQGVIDQLEQIAGERIRFVRWSAPFNFSEKMNLGAAVAEGELLLMLNDDVEVANSAWLDEMVALAERKEFIGAGALLFFEDLSLQHAGHLYRGGAGHVGFGKPLTPRDPNTYLHLDREVSGITGACLLLPKSTFAEVGGFSVQFPGNYNDVDLCLKVRSIGGRFACSGGARLYHFESKSRDATVRPEDLSRIQARWSAQMVEDKYWTAPN